MIPLIPLYTCLKCNKPCDSGYFFKVSIDDLEELALHCQICANRVFQVMDATTPTPPLTLVSDPSPIPRPNPNL